ncbi:50S ribosomal protein L14e [Candidatus Woesearchaeota archaeon]|nr:50S ribosomal protein L14e [Candidatus Woesearchaeota archaeon]
MFEIGSLCLKIAGRDSGGKCVVIKHVDEHHVMIDGETRRRKCNKQHLEPLGKTIDIKENALHEDVIQAFKIMNITIKTTKSKEKTTKPKNIKRKKSTEKAKKNE